MDLGPLDDLPEGRPALRTGKGSSVAVPLAVVRRGARVDVFVGACSHLSGPLHEGSVEDVQRQRLPGLPLARLGVRPGQRDGAQGSGRQRPGEARGAHGGGPRDGPAAGPQSVTPAGAGPTKPARPPRGERVGRAGVEPARAHGSTGRKTFGRGAGNVARFPRPER